MAKKSKDAELVSNRKAFHDYTVVDTYEAGIVLVGTEVKSLRQHGGSLQDAYVLVSDDLKVVLKNAHIAVYAFGNLFNHEEKRDRELLLHKREILKLKSAAAEKGLTLIPLAMYLKNGFVKVKVGVCKGKKSYDKRAALKERDIKRSISSELNN
ncbi:MAG: SsrA-binding protein [Chlamydiota bacterium]|jgi:SsrA-binding protein